MKRSASPITRCSENVTDLSIHICAGSVRREHEQTQVQQKPQSRSVAAQLALALRDHRCDSYLMREALLSPARLVRRNCLCHSDRRRAVSMCTGSSNFQPS
ncbi:hypothetical protein BaRGS_00014292 [Batillaria attramentaria]|uniref:Uncharacterized protein n=1 Tax=Batillaria attramentaria TaxID=370345 RepID=A0ABD0L4V4_9CAEN